MRFLPTRLAKVRSRISVDCAVELRMSARAILGRLGDLSDLEAIESSYESRLGDLESARIWLGACTDGGGTPKCVLWEDQCGRRSW